MAKYREKRKFRVRGEVLFPRLMVDEETMAFSAIQAKRFIRLRLAEKHSVTKVVFGELDITEVETPKNARTPTPEACQKCKYQTKPGAQIAWRNRTAAPRLF